MSGHAAAAPSKSERFDRIVIGAGIFGLQATRLLLERGQRPAVIDVERAPMLRASLVNQARIHNGYHYPRSLFTALRSTRYYHRFAADFPNAVNNRFTKIYAVAAAGSFTDASAFEKFCTEVGVRADEVDPDQWFRTGTVEAAFETDEYSFDAATVRRTLVSRIRARGDAAWRLGRHVVAAHRDGTEWEVSLDDGSTLRAPAVLNATYAGVNQVLRLFGAEPLPIKYELCEVVLTTPPATLRDVGITVMDGPFFSLMPFGATGTHTLTAVEHTPRNVSRDALPTFACQDLNPRCTPALLDDCALCPARPGSAWAEMRQLAAAFLVDGAALRFADSLIAAKAVLHTTEVDDARPTLIVRHSSEPELVTVLSGKVNTIYDLDDVL